MDILLIDPPYTSLKGVSTDCGYHIGLASIAAYLRNEGIETAVLMGDLLVDSLRSNRNRGFTYDVKEYAAGQRAYEATVEDKNHAVWKKLAEIVSEAKPAAVGISYLTPLKYVVERIAGLVKDINRDIKIVAGSSHPTFCPEEVMQNSDVDFVIRGEGEIPLLVLVREFKKASPRWEKVPGIYYRDRGGQVLNTNGVNLIDNLQTLPGGALNNGPHGIQDDIPVNDPQYLDDMPVFDFWSCKRHDLVQQAFSVSHTPFSLSCNHRQPRLTNLNVFLSRDFLQLADDLGYRYSFEIESLTSRQNGHRDFMGFGGCKYELYMGWRLLKCLQEGIKGGQG